MVIMDSIDIKNRIKSIPSIFRKERNNIDSGHQASQAPSKRIHNNVSATKYESNLEFYRDYFSEKSNRPDPGDPSSSSAKDDNRSTQTSIEVLSDPVLEEQILSSLDPLYFESTDLDQFRILNSLPAKLDMHYIDGEKKRLKKQLFVVTKRASTLINEKQELCKTELRRVEDIKESLTGLIDQCRLCRVQLDFVLDNLTRPSIQVISNFQRRTTIEKIACSISNLNMIASDENLSISRHNTPETSPSRSFPPT